MLYDGPFVLNEVAAQPGDEVWSIEIDGFVPHLEQVDARAHARRCKRERAEGETLATVDETLGLGQLSRNGAEPRAGRLGRRAPAAARGARARGGRHRLEGDRAGARVRLASASSSARRSAPTRRSRTRSSTRTSRSSSSRSLAYWAAWCVAENDEQVDLAVAAAKSQAAEAAVLACEKSIQAHGGIGFTWEHPLHRYYKRALWLEGALGYGREHRARGGASLLSS